MNVEALALLNDEELYDLMVDTTDELVMMKEDKKPSADIKLKIIDIKQIMEIIKQRKN